MLGGEIMLNYKVNEPIDADQFIDVLRRSTLGERRPIEDRTCMEGMVRHGNLTVSAWDGEKLVGIVRCLTDFSYICYLSELAVDRDWQRRGVGVELINRAQEALGPRCTIRLISAPGAVAYYEKIGLDRNPQCFELPRGRRAGKG